MSVDTNAKYVAVKTYDDFDGDVGSA